MLLRREQAKYDEQPNGMLLQHSSGSSADVLHASWTIHGPASAVSACQLWIGVTLQKRAGDMLTVQYSQM